jgi:hypothetical protein
MLIGWVFAVVTPIFAVDLLAWGARKAAAGLSGYVDD